MKRRILSTLLALCMVLTLLPTTALAANVKPYVYHQAVEWNPLEQAWSDTKTDFSAARKQIAAPVENGEELTIAAGSKVPVPGTAENPDGTITVDGQKWVCVGYTAKSNNTIVYTEIQEITDASTIPAGTTRLRYYWALEGSKDVTDYQTATCTYDFTLTADTLAAEDQSYLEKIAGLPLVMYMDSYNHTAPISNIQRFESMTQLALPEGSNGLIEKECAVG